MISQEELKEKCDYDPCHCVPDAATAVVQNKSVYCSEGCSKGKGCTMAACHCSTADRD